MKRFPELVGQNLNSEKAVFPRDFSHQWNVVLSGFLMEQQEVLETWMPHVKRWESEFPSIQGYEIPVLPRFDFTSRASIQLSLRWYVGDPRHRSRIYPMFTDVAAFLRATNTPNQNQSRIFLLNGSGDIVVNAPGPARDNLVELIERKISHVQEEMWRPGE